jgi:hypothetical protein
MPILEKYEVQQNRIWYRVEITEEQMVEYLKWQVEGNDDELEWMDNLDWDHHYDKPGHDEVISIEIVDE